MTKTPSSSSQKSPVLHVVYFIDTGVSKTLSIPLRRVQFAVVSLFVLGFLSLMSFALLALYINHSYLGEKNTRELKSALMAQSIVHDDILRQGAFLLASGRNVISNRISEGLARSLLDGTSLRYETEDLGLADAESVDEGVSPISGEASEMESAAAARVLEMQQSDQKVGLEEPFTDGPDDQEPEAPGTPPSTTGESVSEKTGTSAKAPQIPSTDVIPVSVGRIQTSYEQQSQTLKLKFRISKVATDNSLVDGRFCIALEGVAAGGESLQASYPPSFRENKGGRTSCSKGMRVRINRFRDLTVDLPMEQDPEMTGGRFYFQSGERVYQETLSLVRK